jgi:hypothetical protein
MARPKSNNAKEVLQVRLDKTTIKELKETAQKNKTTLSDIVRKKLE